MSAPSSRLVRFTRSLLWYAAFLVVLPLWVYGMWMNTNLWIALFGLPVAVLMVCYSIDKRVCPSCGRAVRKVGEVSSHSMFCGAAYQQNPDPQAARPAD